MHKQTRSATLAAVTGPGVECAARTRPPSRRRPAPAPLRVLATTAMACLMVSGCGRGATEPRPVCGQSPPILPGAALAGKLEPGDATRGNALIDYYTLRLTHPTALLVRMSAQGYTPLLFLFDADARLIGQAYDPDRGPLAELHYPAAAGCYIIGAGAWDPDGRGPYTLEVMLQ